MSREVKCGLHNTKAEYLCVYHREPICVACKYHERHKYCPFEQDHLVELTADIPPSDQVRNHLYDVCRRLYGDVLVLRDGDFFPQGDLKNKLTVLFGNFKTKINDLQNESEKCIDETKSNCKQQFDNVQQNCSNVLIDIRKVMNELFVNPPQDLSEIGEKLTLLRNVVDDKAKEKKACDPKHQ